MRFPPVFFGRNKIRDRRFPGDVQPREQRGGLYKSVFL